VMFVPILSLRIVASLCRCSQTRSSAAPVVESTIGRSRRRR
jgi:hypothetical protein